MDSDHMFHLNFAITLFNHGDVAEARHFFQERAMCCIVPQHAEAQMLW